MSHHSQFTVQNIFPNNNLGFLLIRKKNVARLYKHKKADLKSSETTIFLV